MPEIQISDKVLGQDARVGSRGDRLVAVSDGRDLTVADGLAAPSWQEEAVFFDGLQNNGLAHVLWGGMGGDGMGGGYEEEQGYGDEHQGND